MYEVVTSQSLSTLILIALFMIRYLIRWVDDDSLVEEDGSFTNWWQGCCPEEPSDNGNCMIMGSSTGTWYAIPCDITYHAVCSKHISTTAANNTRT